MLPRSLLLTMCILLHAGTAFASSAPKEEANTRTFAYVPFEPAFIVNVGEAGRVGYLKAEISLRVENAALDVVKNHMPMLRHELILLLSRQKKERLAVSKTVEEVRLEALEAVRKLLKDSDGIEEGVTDLLFTSFLMQS